MPPEHEADEVKGYGPHMTTVAWAILVMGISLALGLVWLHRTQFFFKQVA